MLGCLVAAGYTLDQILDMSFDQIALAAECATLHRIGVVEEVLGPLVTALGGKYKRGKIARPRTQEDRDAALLNQLAAMGIPVD